MKKRPILKLKNTVIEKIFNIVSLLILLSHFLYLIVNWGNIANRIPAHFNLSGEINRWSDKTELLLLPILGLIFWMVLTILEKYPHLYNYDDSKLSIENAKSYYINSRMCINLLKNEVVIIFSLINWNSINITFGNTNYLNYWSLTLICIILIITLLIFIFKGKKIKN